jgi:ribose transport system substrate-binding protein
MIRIRAFPIGLVLVLLAACGGSGGPVSPTPGGTGAGPSASAAITGTPVNLPAGYTSPLTSAINEQADTAKFKKAPPWHIGVSAGFLLDSFVVFQLAETKYWASKNPSFSPDVFVTNANGDAAKQISDIEDMVNRKVDVILYWPVDDQAIQPALAKATAAGIAVVNTGGVFLDTPGVTSSILFDPYEKGVIMAQKLAEALNGKGKVVILLPLAGVLVSAEHERAARDVFKKYPGIEILSVQNGDWNRAKSKTVAEAWLQRYPQIDGVDTSAGQMAIGVAEAFDEAGRLGEVTFSPADEYNGWLKWLASHSDVKGGGTITEGPLLVGKGSVELAAKILGGEPVTKGVRIQALYYSPQDAAALANTSAPDDYWYNDLTSEFLPK